MRFTSILCLLVLLPSGSALAQAAFDFGNETQVKSGPPQHSTLRLMKLDRLPANNASHTLKEIMPEKIGRSVIVVTNGRTLIVRGSKEDVQEVTDLARMLDETFEEEVKEPEGVLSATILSGAGPGVVQTVQRQQAVAGLARNDNRSSQERAAEEAIRSLLIEYHGQSEPQREETHDQTRETLQQRVEELFDAKQQRQQREVESLRLRLKGLELRVEQREQQRPEIIEKRVEDLMAKDGWEKEVSRGRASSNRGQKSELEAIIEGVPVTGVTSSRALPGVGSIARRRKFDVQEAQLRYDLAKSQAESLVALERKKPGIASKAELMKATYEARIRHVQYQRAKNELEAAASMLESVVESDEEVTSAKVKLPLAK